MRTNSQILTSLIGLSMFVATCLVAIADPETTSTALPTLTPEAIYLRSVAAMKDASIPAYVAFRERVSGRNFRLACTSSGMSLNIHHGDSNRTYQVYVRTRDGSAVSQDIADAKASPCSGALLIPAGSAVLALGAPQERATAQANDASSALGGARIIGTVRVNGVRDYHIDLVGRGMHDGSDAYHLHLRAYRNPEMHPLTDLFVDPATFLVREARGEVSAHAVVGSGRIAGVIDFDSVGAFWLVKREHFEVAANALLVHARLNADIEASNMTTPSELPGIAFPTASPSPSVVPARGS